MTPPDPQKIDDIDKVRTLMANARAKEATDLEIACFKRICELEGKDYDDPLVRRFWEAVAAVEECLFQTHGKRVKANYTRRKAREKGERKCLLDWALSPETPGFATLIDYGLPEFTGEYIVAQYPSEFPHNVVMAARTRLIEHGIDISKLPNA